MTDLELLLSGDQKPTHIFGTGYNGPSKPSDWSTAGYLAGFIAAFCLLVWIVFT